MACDSIILAMLQVEECQPDWNASQEVGKNRTRRGGQGKQVFGVSQWIMVEEKICFLHSTQCFIIGVWSLKELNLDKIRLWANSFIF